MGAFGHISFLILTIIFPPMIVLWVVCALCGGSSKRKKALDLQKQNNELLAKLVEQQKQQNIWRGYRE